MTGGDMSYHADTLAENPARREDSNSTADHSKIKSKGGWFISDPDVTRACLRYHTEAGQQFMKNTSRTWKYTHRVIT